MHLRGLVCPVKAVVSLQEMSRALELLAAVLVVTLTRVPATWATEHRAGTTSSLARGRATTTGCASSKRKKTPSRKKSPRAERAKAKTTTSAQEIPKALPPLPNLPAPPALPDRYTAIALLPIEAIEVSDDLLRQVESALLTEIDELAGTRSVTPADVGNDLKTYGLDASRCEGDVVCLARAGRYARAHRALSVQLAALGGTLSIAMQIIDTVAGAEINRVAETLSDDATERAGQLHRLAVQLLTPETYIGTLIVDCALPDADVYLDDVLVGITPLTAPLTKQRAGPHILHLAKPGYADLYRFVDVIYNRTSTVRVDLENNTVSGVIVEAESNTGFGALLVLSNVDGIDVRVDGEPVGTTPLDGPVEKVPAGTRRVSMRQAGTPPLVEKIEVPLGSRVDLAVRGGPDGLTITAMRVVGLDAPISSFEELEQNGDSPPVPGAPRVWSWRAKSGVATAGVGLLALGLASYYANQVRVTANRRDAIVDRWADPPATRADYDALVQDADELRRLNRRGVRAAALQWTALGASVGLSLVGGALYAWDLRRGAPLLPFVWASSDAASWHMGLNVRF